jgi:hypothetical protein
VIHAEDVEKFASVVLTFSKDIIRTKRKQKKPLTKKVGFTVVTWDFGLWKDN